MTIPNDFQFKFSKCACLLHFGYNVNPKTKPTKRALNATSRMHLISLLLSFTDFAALSYSHLREIVTNSFVISDLTCLQLADVAFCWLRHKRTAKESKSVEVIAKNGIPGKRR